MEQERKSKWMKMSSIPEGKEIQVQILNRESKEQFSVWDNHTKTYIKEGEKIVTSQGEMEVNKFLPLKKLGEEGQRWSKKEQYVRNVVVNGEKLFLPFPKTAEKALVDLMDTLNKVGKDPLSMYYMIKKLSSEGIVKYEVKLGTPVPDGEVNLARVQANERENKIINAIKADPVVNAYDKESKVKVLMGNKNVDGNFISEPRARELVESYF